VLEHVPEQVAVRALDERGQLLSLSEVINT
jgi:hypothetical protein